MQKFQRRVVYLGVAILGLWTCAWGAGPPGEEKPSTYAPIEDLDKQVTFYSDRINTALADKADYDEAKQGRVKKDANTLAVLALTVGMHDGESKLKGNAAAIIKAAQGLAKNFENYDLAKAGADALKTALSANGGAGVKSWDVVADLPTVMRAVPLVNNSLKKAATDLSKGKNAELAAGASATLAAIAQGTLNDLSAVKKKEDAAKWRQFSLDMRDAAGSVNKLAHDKKQDGMEAAMSRLSKTCEDCHAVFRPHEK